MAEMLRYRMFFKNLEIIFLSLLLPTTIVEKGNLHYAKSDLFKRWLKLSQLTQGCPHKYINNKKQQPIG